MERLNGPILMGGLYSEIIKGKEVFSFTYDKIEPVPAFSTSSVDEFNSLNHTIQGLLMKITHDYQRTKVFNENASHELQTHLAIIRLNSEKLINTAQQNCCNPEYIQPILNATVKLSQVQKSLLLLSKIGNLEYNNTTRLNILDIIDQSLAIFHEAIVIRSISIHRKIQNCVLIMDAGLAEILVNNLMKNAVKHNIQNGYLSIHLTQNALMVENTGLPYDGNPVTLFERFAIGTTGNIGLGLAIVKQICDVYDFDLSYVIDGNVHKINISFPAS